MVENALTEQEIRAFVGSKADTYLERWRPALDEADGDTGFNWAAFLLSGFWIPYRKMYRTALIFYAIILIESVMEDVLFVGILRKPETPSAVGSIVGIVVAFICGLYGNRWYLSHTQKAVEELRSQELPEEEYLQALSKRGGTSLLAAFGFFFMFFVGMLIVVILVDTVLARG